VLRAGGTVPKATGQQTETYPAVHDDGDDVIFGDLGNDWIVGGTGKDHLYGGWGDDLMNADDNHDSTIGTGDPRANDVPDTHPTYEDLAYGGAGRDVLIGNTGGDRLIDWVGEFNSYLVPFAPFGMATVSRTIQPQLPVFLYALSKSDGADQTLGFDTTRNGEPFAELGAVIQKDFSWQDQTGAPADPQAGNIPGGRRDVLRSATFNNPGGSGGNLNLIDGFAVDSGTWSVANGVLQVTADSKGKDAASVFYVDQALPSYYEILASLQVTKPTAGWKANAYIIFDYYGPKDFKFAGIDVSLNRFVMGHRNAEGWILDAFTPTQVKPEIFYNLLLAVNGTTATLMLDNKKLFSYVYAPRVVDGYACNLNTGMVGVGSDNSRGLFDNITVQRLAPPITLERNEEFTAGAGAFTGPQSGTWQVNTLLQRYEAAPPAGSDRAVSLVELGTGKGLAVSSILEFETKLKTTGTGGIVFDYYTADDFKYVAVNANTNQVVIGHHTKKGWFTDAVASRTIGNSDHKLGISLKEKSVSVTLDGQAVTGFVYNAAVVDGKFGLFTANGISSFDTAAFRTDDPAFAAPVAGAKLAAAEPARQTGTGTASLSYDSLGPVLNEAVDRLSASTGTGQGEISWLNNVAFQITDLPGNTIGMAEGFTVLLDSDAAGYGWSANGMDLMSAVEHELGHILGLDHAAGTFMSPTLSAGERLLQPAGNGLHNPAILRPEADLLAPSLHGSGWDVSGSGLHGSPDWSVDMGALTALYGRGADELARYEGFGLYADGGRVGDTGPLASGSDWEVDLGYAGPSGKGKVSGKKGRTL
jgi:hypothetical protein